MFLKACNKVVVIDDKIEEALPLIKLLSQQGANTLYYSGIESEFPEHPLEGVRLVFCDLRYNSSTEAKNVVSNVIGILNKIIDANNGPYILLVWSAHEDEYYSLLKETLKQENINPEFIIALDKTNYFETVFNMTDVQTRIIDELEKADLDVLEEQTVKEIIERNLKAENFSIQSMKPDALEKIAEKLKEELSNEKLFHLFVLWEETMGKSAVKTVNTIYKEMNSFEPKERLKVMFFFLAHSRLEKRFDEANGKQKFWSALEALNDLFPYFYNDNVHSISAELFDPDSIEEFDVSAISCSKFNRWRIISTVARDKRPGNVFIDQYRLFKPHGWINQGKVTSSISEEMLTKRILDENNVTFILVDISSECDIAQKKLYVSRVVPGIIITKDHFESLKKDNIIKGKLPDCFYCSPELEIDGTVHYVFFNTNQMIYAEKDELEQLEYEFSFTEQFVTQIKQTAVRCISKAGLDAFS